MKKLTIILLLLLTACKKDDISIISGHTYRVKPNIFNTGVFQPKDTLYANSIYYNEAAGINYCRCTGPSKGTLLSKVKPDSLNGNLLWLIPTDDLKK